MMVLMVGSAKVLYMTICSNKDDLYVVVRKHGLLSVGKLGTRCGEGNCIGSDTKHLTNMAW